MEYKVIQLSSEDGFVLEVNVLMKQGWKTNGGMSVIGGGVGPDGRQIISFYQAMIREDSPNKNAGKADHIKQVYGPKEQPKDQGKEE